MDYINEGCISRILSRTTPRDACRSAAVSSIFRSANEYDIVWKSFLPADYEEIISKSVSPSLADLSSKKELYFRLCDTPLLVEGHNLRTTPRDACRSAAVCSIFRSASESDIVWKSFLPSDYEEIISRSVSPSLADLSSKKELYFRLCDTPLLIEGCNLSFGLEKWSGKKCYMMGARELEIGYGDTIYWKWTSLPESRFAEVAELVTVFLLEIRGKMDTGKLSPKTNYAAYFVFKIREGDHGWEGDLGWKGDLGFNYVPAEVLVRVTGGDGDGELREVFLSRRRESNREMEAEVPKKRSDGWMEIEMGEFFNAQGEDEVEMSLLEAKGRYWKAGLVVEGIELRPKESK